MKLQLGLDGYSVDSVVTPTFEGMFDPLQFDFDLIAGALLDAVDSLESRLGLLACMDAEIPGIRSSLKSIFKPVYSLFKSFKGLVEHGHAGVDLSQVCGILEGALPLRPAACNISVHNGDLEVLLTWDETYQSKHPFFLGGEGLSGLSLPGSIFSASGNADIAVDAHAKATVNVILPASGTLPPSLRCSIIMFSF